MRRTAVITGAIVVTAVFSLACQPSSGTNERGEGPRPRLTETAYLPAPRTGNPQTARVPAPITTELCRAVYNRTPQEMIDTKAVVLAILNDGGADPRVSRAVEEFYLRTSSDPAARAQQLQSRYAIARQACLNAGVPE